MTHGPYRTHRSVDPRFIIDSYSIRSIYKSEVISSRRTQYSDLFVNLFDRRIGHADSVPPRLPYTLHWYAGTTVRTAAGPGALLYDDLLYIYRRRYVLERLENGRRAIAIHRPARIPAPESVGRLRRLQQPLTPGQLAAWADRGNSSLLIRARRCARALL